MTKRRWCFSTQNSIIPSTHRQGAVEKVLGYGEKKALTSKELLDVTGVSSARLLRSEIEQERKRGALILSTVRGRGGYFLPDPDPERGRAEIEAFVRTVHCRAISSMRTLRAARKALRECSGQEEIREDV